MTDISDTPSPEPPQAPAPPRKPPMSAATKEGISKAIKAMTTVLIAGVVGIAAAVVKAATNPDTVVPDRMLFAGTVISLLLLCAVCAMQFGDPTNGDPK